MHTGSAPQTSTPSSLCACIGYVHHYSFFLYLRLQYKWDRLSSNNSRHTSCIHKGLQAGKWPDLMASKPDALSTLGYHWTYYTGITLHNATAQWSSSGNPVLICIIGTHWQSLEPQVHCDVTGTTLTDASTKWYPSGNPVLICIIGTHWQSLEPQVHCDVTGTTLTDASTKWYPSGNPVLICIIKTHRKTNERPLKHHWRHTGNTLATEWHSSVHWGLSYRHTGLPLNYLWLRERDVTVSRLYHHCFK